MQTPKCLITQFSPSSCKYRFLSYKYSQYSPLIALRLTSLPLTTQSSILVTKQHPTRLISSLRRQVYEICNIGTKCNSLTQQFIGISTTIDTWAKCFDSIESSSGPQRLQIQFLQGSQVHSGIPNAYIIAS